MSDEKVEEVLSMEEQAKKLFRELNKQNSDFNRKFDKESKEFYQKSQIQFAKMLKVLEQEKKEVKKSFVEVLELLQTVDSTLCNVLLAIRQNEYLQAWYPNEQNKTMHAADAILQKIQWQQAQQDNKKLKAI